MRTIEIARSQSKVQRILFVCVGTSLVLGGIIGLFLPIVPGLLALVAGAVLLSRECPPLHRALEKCQAGSPVVRGCIAGLPKVYATWRRRFRCKARDSETTVLIWNAATPRQEDFQMSDLGCDGKKNSDCSEAVCASVKILIFDQNLEDLAFHAEAFEARGFEVYKCTSIEAALRCIEREELDFALVDQASTTFEGLRIIRHLVRYNLHTPFIVLTRQKDMPSYQQALSLGALDYLQKPVPMTEMNWIIDRHFGNPTKHKKATRSGAGLTVQKRS